MSTGLKAMNVSESESVVLRLQGRLDAQTCAVLQQELAAIEADRFRLWILDLAQVDFIDSCGIVALVTGLKLAAKRKCRLAICNLHPSVRLIFEITQLDQVLDCYTDQDLAEIDSVETMLPLFSRLPAAA
jgi:anti-sigma B factor antagonist